ncbi:putative reverse transcriptase domain-containing protein [Tanacetum coccineum]
MDRIPSNIIFEIFSRVPARCLARSRCISTVWCKYIDDRYLTIIHDKRLVEEPTPILYHQHLCIKKITLSLCFHVTESKQAGTADLVFKPTKGSFLEFIRKKPLSRSSVVRIEARAYSGPRFGDWQWRLSTLPFAFEGLGVYSTGDVLNYAFLASRLQSTSLQTKQLRHSDIITSGPAFDNALNAFNTKIEIDILSNPSELRVVPISGLGQTMNGRTYRCVLCYRLGVPLFSVLKPCSACSKVFAGDIYRDHVVSRAGVIGIKHQHNVVRDTLVDICFRSGILAGKEVDIGLSGGRDKPLRPADMLLYSWDEELDVCMDLTGSSPLTQTGMVDFVPGRAVIDASHRKRVKYEAKCADIGYGFLPFLFYSLGELEKDVVTLLKRIQKFSMTQDIVARAVIQIFNRISFAIAKGMGVQLVSRLSTNFL